MADSVQSKHFTKIKLSILFVTILIATGTVSATDLNNIESITPSGTTPISITGDLDLNNNNINNFFGSSCSTGNLAVHVNDDGTLDCVDATSEVQNDFVDRSGDTMTGNLDMQSNNIESVNVLTVDSVDLTGGFGTGGIDLGNEALYNLDSFSFNDPGTDGSIDWAGSGAEIYPAPLDDSNSDGYLQIVNDGGIAFEPGSDGTTAATFETGGNLNLKDNQLNNVDWANSDNPDTTIADNQQLSISGDTISLDNGGSVTINDANNHDDQTLSTTADVSGTDDQISITEGNSITIDDDYAANTDASTKCGSDQVLEGGNNCVSNYEAGDDGDSSSSNELQSLSGVVGRGNSISSGQTIDTSAGAFRLPTGADAY